MFKNYQRRTCVGKVFSRILAQKRLKKRVGRSSLISWSGHNLSLHWCISFFHFSSLIHFSFIILFTFLNADDKYTGWLGIRSAPWKSAWNLPLLSPSSWASGKSIWSRPSKSLEVYWDLVDRPARHQKIFSQSLLRFWWQEPHSSQLLTGQHQCWLFGSPWCWQWGKSSTCSG